MHQDDFSGSKNVGKSQVGKTYTLGIQDGYPFIHCVACDRRSFHFGDVQNLYCGHCHRFHAEMVLDEAISQRVIHDHQATSYRHQDIFSPGSEKPEKSDDIP